MSLQLLGILLFLGFCGAAVDNVAFFSDQLRDGHHQKTDRSGAKVVTVTINLQQSVNSISSHYVGVTIDSQQIRYNWNGFDFNSLKVQNMARALAPTYFRLGGTAADFMDYDLNSYSNQKSRLQRGQVYCSNFTTPFSMTADQWEKLNEFLQTVGWDFIMDLNALKRNADGSWNSDNARQLLQFSAKKNYTIAGFELGNEYNLYSGTPVKPSQLAADYVTLQKLLGEFPQYYSSFLLGPETANEPSEFFEGFLAAGGYKTVRASSFHEYYFSAKNRNLSQFTSISVMDQLATDIDSAMAQTRAVDPLLPVWLSETSTAYGCGTANMSDRFVAGFLWLDKLGLSAVKGVQSVIRQTFYGFNYGLIDLDLNPNPDFWLTYLYKNIVQGPVFNTTVDSNDVRVYAACTNPKNFPLGSVALYILNPNDYNVIFDMPQFGSQLLTVWLLTPGDSKGLLSKSAKVNGIKVEMDHDRLPIFLPRGSPDGRVSMEPYSYGFAVAFNVRVPICMDPR